jgi:DUF971 family protein
MPTPSAVKLHKKSKQLEVVFGEQPFHLSAEYLRVFSPSAEVKGHHPSEEKLQTGKQNVGIDHIESAGNYAIKILFDDGHDSGIYSWDYLYELGTNFDQNWRNYLNRLSAAGQSRDPNTSIVKLIDPVDPKSST